MSVSDEPGSALDVTQPSAIYTLGTAPKKTPLTVTTIAHYKTDETYNIGRLIASKPQFICYAVKGNMVRIISTSNSSRILLREHKEPIHDLVFLAGGEGEEALLITCAKDGLLVVWQLVQEAVELRGDPAARLQVDSSIHYQRVVAHPTDRNLFAACHGLPSSSDSVVKVFQTQQLLAAAKEHAGAPLDGAIAPGLTIRVPSEVVVMAFGPDQLLAVGTRNGHVSLFHSGNGSLVHSWAAHDGPVQALEWFAGGRALLTAAKNNSLLRLWDALSGWQRCHELVVAPADSASNILTADASSGLVFVASIKQPSLAVFHVASNSHRFDYVAEFPVTYPILSFISISKPPVEGERVPIQLFCLQTAAVQRFDLFDDQCLPARLRAGAVVSAAAPTDFVPFSILPIAGITLSQLASPQKFDETKKREQEAAAAAAEAQRQQEEAEARQRAEVAAATEAAATEAAERLAATAAAAAPQQVDSTPTAQIPASSDQPASLAPSSQDVTEDQQRRQEAALRIQKAYRRAHQSVPPANQAEAPDSPATTTALAPPTPAPATATVTFKEDTTLASGTSGSSLAPGLLPITALSDKDDKDHGKRDSKRRNENRPVRPGTKTQLLPKLKEADESDKHTVPSSGDEGRKSRDEDKKDKKRDKVAKPATKRSAAVDNLDERDQKLLAAFQARLDERDRHLAELVSKQVAKQVQEVVLPAMNNAIKGQQDTLRRALLQSVDEAALRGPMQAAFSTCFQQSVLPQFERAVQNMFEQMQVAFDRGLAQNLARLPSAASGGADASGAGVSALQERNLQLQSMLTENLRTATSTLIHLGDSLSSRVDAKAGRREKAEKTRVLPPASAAPPPTSTHAAPPAALPDALSMSVVHKPAAAATHTPAASPSAPTPAAPSVVGTTPLIAAPVSTLKPLPNQLDGLVRRGQFAKAFNIALNAGELEPVAALCEHLRSPSVILNVQPCPLSSLELLSLVQQLSTDLNRSTSSKLLWIGESLKHLLPSDPDIRDELPGVLHQLYTALGQQQARDPHNTELVALQAAVRARLGR